jgi:hypothetical protein
MLHRRMITFFRRAGEQNVAPIFTQLALLGPWDSLEFSQGRYW